MQFYISIGGKMLKITVVIPCYNAEIFIDKCLNSITNQTLNEIEIIVINDGSTDKSLDIINNHKNNNNLRIVDKKNEGTSQTRNLGIDLAKGEYIYFVDADDYLENKFVLEKIYNECKKNDLDILVFDYFRDNNDNKEYINFLKGDSTFSREAYLIGLIKERYWGGMCNKIIKKTLFIDNNIKFPKNIFLREDLVTSSKLFYYAKKIGKLEEALYNYVIHKNQGTKTISREKFYSDGYAFHLELENFFINKNNIPEIVEILELQKWNFCYHLLRKKYKNLKIYTEVKKNIKNSNNKYYKKWPLIKKLKFYYKLNF